MIAWLADTSKEPLPMPSKYEQAVTRKEDFVKSPRGQFCFKFHWDVVLPKAALSQHWPESVRYNLDTTICNSMNHQWPTKIFPNGVHYITPAMEAVAFVMYKNLFYKLSWIAEETKKDPGFKVDLTDEHHKNCTKCLYNNPHAANDMFGKWSLQGQRVHRDIRRAIMEARKQKWLPEYEAMICKQVRQESGKFPAEVEDRKPKAKSKKRKAPPQRLEEDPLDDIYKVYK